MDDEALASLVAADLVSHLAGRAEALSGPVYAVALWADDCYGLFGVSIATETAFAERARAPHYVQHPDTLVGLDGVRWSSGDWEVCAEDFVSAATEEALRPLAWPMSNEGFDLDADVICAAAQRWELLGYRVVELADSLSVLNTTRSALAYAETPELAALEKAQAMQHNVSPARMDELFPEWVRMAAEVRAVRADPHRMADLQTMATVTYPLGYLPQDEPMPDELTALLRLCGLGWQSVLDWTDQLQQALEVADWINPSSDRATVRPPRSLHDH